MIDILFITRIGHFADIGPTIYKDIRLSIAGEIANIPFLRILNREIDLRRAKEIMQQEEQEDFRVLTPFYLEEFYARRNVSFKSIDCLMEQWDEVEDTLKSGARIIALSSTWHNGAYRDGELRKSIQKLRKLAPQTPIVLGGIGVQKGRKIAAMMEEDPTLSLFPQWLYTHGIGGITQRIGRSLLSKYFFFIDPKKDSIFDVFISGDHGEVTLLEFLNRLKSNQELTDIPNLAFPKKDGYLFTPEKKIQLDLDKEIINWAKYTSKIDEGYMTPISVGMGCPYKCGFCDFRGIQSVFNRSPASVVAEVKSLLRAFKSPQIIYFVSDNLGINKKQVVDFTQTIIKEKLNISWQAFMGVNHIDDEVASLLRVSGCNQLFLGIESGDPQIQKNMKKNIDPEKALRSMEALDEQGIRTVNTFIVGFPGETASSLQKTTEFISSIPSGASAKSLHRFYLFRFLVSPLSLVASKELRAKYNLKGVGHNWSHKTMSAAEAKKATQELFMNVRGPSHLYRENMPIEWDINVTRALLERRDTIKRETIHRKVNRETIRPLLDIVKEAETNKKSYRL